MDKPDDEKLPLIAHLEELKTRLIRAIIALGAGFLICYGLKEQLFAIITRPLVKVLPAGAHLIFIAPAEAFVTYLKISFYFGLFISSPYIFLQVWKFISPGLYDHEKKHVVPFVIFATLLFLLGALFCYFFVIPLAFEFFLAFTSEFLKPMFTMKEYLSLSLQLIFLFGLSFELPVFIFFLAKIGLVDASFLSRHRRYAILLIFIIAAILTPPDVVSQVMMAVPLMVLYEISIYLAKYARKEKLQQEAENEG
ncbi:MAG: twin-arginine translocase subunit TatC [Smithellaceae bacterium]|nr:twin-arginine translocase subunit TatC [Smithellaceae bacterium]